MDYDEQLAEKKQDWEYSLKMARIICTSIVIAISLIALAAALAR